MEEAAASSLAPLPWLQEARRAKSETMSLVLWRSVPFRRGLKAEWSEELPFPSEPQHAILLPTYTKRIFEHGKKQSLRHVYPLLDKAESMDKNEAERLARAIRMMQMDWIKVDGIVHNSATNQYEVQCSYQSEDQGQALSRSPWTTLKIKSPRQWIEILTQHSGGSELS